MREQIKAMAIIRECLQKLAVALSGGIAEWPVMRRSAMLELSNDLVTLRDLVAGDGAEPDGIIPSPNDTDKSASLGV